MTLNSKVFHSWGRFPKVMSAKFLSPNWNSELLNLKFSDISSTSVLPVGALRSYGDCCLSSEGTYIEMNHLTSFESFDTKTGILTVQGGTTIDSILRSVVPRGWFMPVTPGTKYVTIGGAIANDVHGKNHHISGTFGGHVLSLKLLRSSGEVFECSRGQNSDFFAATIGGLGLTGIILSATIQLKSISSSEIEQVSQKFYNLDDFFAISEASDDKFEYTVSWIDCVSTGGKSGRGIFMGGNHSSNSKLVSHKKPILSMPFNLPSGTLNKYTVKLFNELYFNKQLKDQLYNQVHYNPFFYPLDLVNNWNKIYGQAGFLQFQCVVNEKAAIKEIIDTICKSKQASFLAILKKFGSIPSIGLLSFPRPGYTLALDFPNKGQETLMLYKKLEELVIEADGAIYPAKDAVMSPEAFRSSFPKFEEFLKFRDPLFSSDFSKRVLLT